MQIRRALSVLLTVILITAMFIPTGFAEGADFGAESAEQTDDSGDAAFFSTEACDSNAGPEGVVPTVSRVDDAAVTEYPAQEGYEPDSGDSDAQANAAQL